jgi:hypothetical protein
MSMPETIYRVRKTIYGRIQRLGFLTAKDAPNPNFIKPTPNAFAGCSSVDISRYQTVADRILSGRIKLFELGEVDIGVIPRWNRDIKSGITAPLVFGKTLNYRDESLVGDIKYLWEPNRHLQLANIAQAYHLSKDPKYLKGLRNLLDSWFEQCPYMLGPNWTSSLELGIRLINWSLAWQLIGGLESPVFKTKSGEKFRDRWLRSIYQHMHFIAGHFSRYSSGNNHLIGEAAGLFVACVTWPYWQETRRWCEKAKTILEHEALAQNAEDGVNLEQAISYQQFVLDFLVISALTGRAANMFFSSAYWSRIESMLMFVASMMDYRGHVPMIGDADDGYVMRLEASTEWCPYRSLLATGAVLFNNQFFKAKAGSFDEKTRWLLGDAAAACYEGMPLPPGQSLLVRRAFENGGYYILGDNLEAPCEIRCYVDAAPLGYQRIAAHGHADALSIILSLDGNEYLIDPGTFAYHTQQKWRNYFRGTAAHNTVRVDGMDQSISGGNFMWLQHAAAQCVLWDSGDAHDRFIGMHDGYRRLKDPVTHRREILLDKPKRRLTVIDTLECNDRHEVEVFWHFSPTCSVMFDEEQVVATNDNTKIILRGDGSFVMRTGDHETPSGWISPSFGVKTPTVTVTDRRSIWGTTQIVTTIDCITG